MVGDAFTSEASLASRRLSFGDALATVAVWQKQEQAWPASGKQVLLPPTVLLFNHGSQPHALAGVALNSTSGRSLTGPLLITGPIQQPRAYAYASQWAAYEGIPKLNCSRSHASVELGGGPLIMRHVRLTDLPSQASPQPNSSMPHFAFWLPACLPTSPGLVNTTQGGGPVLIMEHVVVELPRHEFAALLALSLLPLGVPRADVLAAAAATDLLRAGSPPDQAAQLAALRGMLQSLQHPLLSQVLRLELYQQLRESQVLPASCAQTVGRCVAASTVEAPGWVGADVVFTFPESAGAHSGASSDSSTAWVTAGDVNILIALVGQLLSGQLLKGVKASQPAQSGNGATDSLSLAVGLGVGMGLGVLAASVALALWISRRQPYAWPAKHTTTPGAGLEPSKQASSNGQHEPAKHQAPPVPSTLAPTSTPMASERRRSTAKSKKASASVPKGPDIAMQEVSWMWSFMGGRLLQGTAMGSGPTGCLILLHCTVHSDV